MYNQVSDDLFEQFAEKAEREREARGNRRGFNSFEPREEIRWYELKTGEPAIVRFVGAPAGMSDDPTTMRSVFIARVLDDNGKQTKVVHTDPIKDKDYILNKIINKVLQVKWDNSGEKGVKFYPVEKEYPDIFNWVNKGGYKPDDPQYKFSHGIRGRECLLANVIPRQDPWCVENKHTELLAKSIYRTEDGREFVEEGISTYGVMDRLTKLVQAYGSFERWDCAILKSSSMNNPYTVINANVAKAEIPKRYHQYISTMDHLTEEELNYERYNLAELFKPTSYAKIYNRFQQWIKKIDAALDTDFYDLLLEGVEREKKERAEKESEVPSYTSTSVVVDEPVKEILNKKTEDDEPPFDVDTPSEPIKEEVKEPAVRATRTRKPVTETKHEPWMDLPYGENIPEELKSKVLAVIKDADGDVKEIKWDYPEDQLAACFNEEAHNGKGCSCTAPIEILRCPACNIEF